MKTPQPFCCDITSGTDKERNEFERLYSMASNDKWGFLHRYYGYKHGKWKYEPYNLSAIQYFSRILPLSEGIAILKQMVGEGEKENDGWISVKDRLPETLETVWISNGKGFTTLGCRSDLYEGDNGKFEWCWAAIVNGGIYESEGKIVAECDEDDLEVNFWMPLPTPPKIDSLQPKP